MFSLSEKDLESLILQEESKFSFEAMLQRKRAFTDPVWQKVLDAGFSGDLAEQIVARYYAEDWDYTTSLGVVISNVFFPREEKWSEEKRPSDIGAKDLPLMMIPKVSHSKVRPKLPGKMWSKEQMKAIGRKTCYELCERVGDAFFGIYPYKRICSCCLYNDWSSFKELELLPWHEGLMIMIDNVEYRVKKKIHLDRLFNGVVWEMVYDVDNWKPVRPRELGRYPQSDSLLGIIVTVSMLSMDEHKLISGKRNMSKVIVQGKLGLVLVDQGGVWDFPGGKQELNDLSPLHTAQREYEEELGVVAPELEYVGCYESSLFLVHLYFASDDRLNGGQDSDLLTGPQLDTWNEFFLMIDKKRGREVAKDDYKQRFFLANKKEGGKNLIYSQDDLPLPIRYFLSDGSKAYYCDHPRWKEIVQRGGRKSDCIAVLTERWWLKKKYNMNIGNQFFQVNISNVEQEDLVMSYIARMSMKYELRGNRVIAWADNPIARQEASIQRSTVRWVPKEIHQEPSFWEGEGDDIVSLENEGYIRAFSVPDPEASSSAIIHAKSKVVQRIKYKKKRFKNKT